MRALVVDDERNVRFLLQEVLQRADFEVTTAADGERALELFHDTRFDLMVLDLRLGGRTDGMRLLRTARWRWPDCAVVILTAHGTLESAVEAIREDVDGYLLKPVESSELLHTVQEAIERRAVLRQGQGQDQRVLEHGPIRVDLDKHLVSAHGARVDLTPQEFKLLVCLFENHERVVTPKELVQIVRDYVPDSTHEARQIIKWTIHSLRHKVERDPRAPETVVNVRGVGYTLGPLQPPSCCDR